MEPIEKWRKEFISTFKVNFNHLSDEYFRLDKSGNFEDGSTFFRFEGFCQARRSQPVVELPMPDRNDHTDVAFYIQKLRESLADAGIQYRMKGE